MILALFSIIMFYTGGMQSIQNLLIITALTFSIIIILMICSFFKALHDYHKLKMYFENYKSHLRYILFYKKIHMRSCTCIFLLFYTCVSVLVHIKQL
ncbi:hypothetical protein GCM10007203_10490 [Staphylococcus nepalensis]|nr:hypothetical protein GCM10007203_10490 [Staphylococcus nepalensis]